MTNPIASDPPPGAVCGMRRGTAPWADMGMMLPRAGLVVLLVCSCFGVCASCVVLGYSAWRSFPDGADFAVRVLAKAVVFGGVGLASVMGLRRFAGGAVVDFSPTPLSFSRDTFWKCAGFLGVLLFCSALVVPNLARYPWLGPDEAHHLIVARNLAEHGVYGSGHPSEGFVAFDAYDSVGAPVIMGTALAFRGAGTSLGVARLTAAGHFLLLVLLVFLFMEPLAGTGAALLSVLVLPMTDSSIYLSRTLYGEVPELMYFVLGLLCWRRGLRSERVGLWGLLAGMAFGAAALCKTIFLMTAFAFAGAWVYDRLTFRRIRERDVTSPGLGFMAVYGAWVVYKQLAGMGRVPGGEDVLSLYQSLLLAGLDGIPHTAAFLWREPWPFLSFVIVGAGVAPWIFRRRYDPASVVLYLAGMLHIFWWFFFTSGQLPRYIWFGYGCMAVLAGCVLGGLVAGLIKGSSKRGRRWACGVVLCVMLLPAAWWAGEQARLVYGADEMADERILSDFVRSLEPGTGVATTYYPLSRTLNFLANRSVPWVQDAAHLPPDVKLVIVDQRTQQDLLVRERPRETVGRYAILTRWQ